MIQNNMADGIYLARHVNVNCCIVQHDDRCMTVDAGLPSMWDTLIEVLRDPGLAPEPAEALC